MHNWTITVNRNTNTKRNETKRKKKNRKWSHELPRVFTNTPVHITIKWSSTWARGGVNWNAKHLSRQVYRRGVKVGGSTHENNSWCWQIGDAWQLSTYINLGIHIHMYIQICLTFVREMKIVKWLKLMC